MMIRWLRGVVALVASPYVMIRMIVHLRRHARVLSRSMLPVAMIFVMTSTVMMVLARPANAACTGTISSLTSVTGATPYDPYSAAANVGTYQLQVTNGAGTCKYALIFRTSTTPAKFTSASGTALVYTIAGNAAVSLSSYAKGVMDYTITIGRGQFAAPGSYSDDSIYADLYLADNNGNPTGSRVSYKRMDITYNVTPCMSVNIKGDPALTSVTMELGALYKGQQGTVEIQARGNQKYQLDVRSEHQGALVLTPAVAGKTWSVPYAATFAGQALNLSGTSSVVNQPATRPESDATYPLIVAVGDTTAKRAGRYEDTITIELRAMTP